MDEEVREGTLPQGLLLAKTAITGVAELEEHIVGAPSWQPREGQGDPEWM